MDSRLYFVLGDLFANILVGAVVGWLTALIVSPGWNMWIAMFVMMPVGMLLSMLLWMPMSIYLGAMEVMLPTMFTGMFSAMVIGMDAAMAPMASAVAFKHGAVIGLVVIVAIWVVNNSLRGIQRG
jgi:hypothetical protein